MKRVFAGESTLENGMQTEDRLRVALVVGTLSKGGAEKQLVYMARALRDAGVEVRVFCLTRGEYYEQALAQMGITPIWFGQSGSPILRLWKLVQIASDFRPHIFQSTHFYTNLYAALAARMLDAISIGAIRSSMKREMRANGVWARWLLRLPAALIANSHPACERAIHAGFPAERIHVLNNVIDLKSFDRAARQVHRPILPVTGRPEVRAVIVARLVKAKRHDRFLRALAGAREKNPHLRGVIVGDGPLRGELEAEAARLNLLPGGVEFLGERHDVPAVLNQSDLLVLTSDEEGFPNAILEGMAACLPVITTPAGEAATVVEEGISGYVIPFDDEEIMSWQMVRIASKPALRAEMGQAGRHLAERVYNFKGLAPRLLSLYETFARLENRPGFADMINKHHKQVQPASPVAVQPGAGLAEKEAA